MFKQQLLNELTQRSHEYGNLKLNGDYLHQFSISKNAVIYKELEHNFFKKSWRTICANNKLFERTQKVHSHFKGSNPPILEMQSSNSSDALVMNIFCHPKILINKGILDLLKVDSLQNIDFGFKANLAKEISGKPVNDNTEVDFYIKNEIIGECKLTEGNFTSKDEMIVHQYKKLQRVFHVDKLSNTKMRYDNYQLIRNILAAEEHNCRFVLFCDMRRPDLVKHFIETVTCIKDEYLTLRQNCEVIYWQDIARVSNKDLKEFLNIKYGII